MRAVKQRPAPVRRRVGAVRRWFDSAKRQRGAAKERLAEVERRLAASGRIPRVSAARGPEVASRVGIALGIALTICFATGLISHWIQHPPSWFYWPANPPWLYRVTQGTHVITGVMSIPLLLVKLWSVMPRLIERPVIGSLLRLLERGSIVVLVGAVVFQLVTGLFNIAQFYPWKFFFTTTHYAMAYVAFGALMVHVAVKLPVVRDALSRPVEGVDPGNADSSDESESSEHQRISRRTVLGVAGVSAVVAGLAVAGQSVPWLRGLSVLAPRSGKGPQALPVNRTSAAAGVRASAVDPDYRLTVSAGERTRALTRADLLAMPQTTAILPIACVEGWSVSAHWTGVRLRDLLAAAHPGWDGDVRFTSLETGGLYRVTVLPHRHAVDAQTLVALGLNGEVLDLDHGYPCRLIAPTRPGVLQTKWLSRIEVL